MHLSQNVGVRNVSRVWRSPLALLISLEQNAVQELNPPVVRSSTAGRYAPPWFRPDEDQSERERSACHQVDVEQDDQQFFWGGKKEFTVI